MMKAAAGVFFKRYSGYADACRKLSLGDTARATPHIVYYTNKIVASTELQCALMAQHKEEAAQEAVTAGAAPDNAPVNAPAAAAAALKLTELSSRRAKLMAELRKVLQCGNGGRPRRLGVLAARTTPLHLGRLRKRIRRPCLQSGEETGGGSGSERVWGSYCPGFMTMGRDHGGGPNGFAPATVAVRGARAATGDDFDSRSLRSI